MVLTKGAGINAPPIAEFVVLCVLSAAKQFPFFVAGELAPRVAADRPPPSRWKVRGRSSSATARSDARCGRLRLASLWGSPYGVRRQGGQSPTCSAPTSGETGSASSTGGPLTAALTAETHHMLGRASSHA